MEYLFIGLGGTLGSLARYLLGRAVSEKAHTTFPLGTFLINLTGALLLGFINGIGISRSAGLFLADGFLGAFTTFSTFMYEGFNLFQENEKLNALIYIISSVILGIIGFVAGFAIGKVFTGI